MYTCSNLIELSIFDWYYLENFSVSAGFINFVIIAIVSSLHSTPPFYALFCKIFWWVLTHLLDDKKIIILTKFHSSSIIIGCVDIKLRTISSKLYIPKAVAPLGSIFHPILVRTSCKALERKINWQHLKS